MAPIAIHTPDVPVAYSPKQAVRTDSHAVGGTTTDKRTDANLLARRPKVFTLEPLHSRALALAREKFDLVLPTDAEFDAWPTQAEGLLARNAVVSPENTKILKENKIRFISKQGVGVDNFDLDALKECGIPLMNTPGVNASQ
jgi:phosphoglycerate dehydrogenase-like enzyme